ncbi:hypothetical protein [Methanosarcina sp.]|jgi:hypothetical protein|nr:hypothetical protein [Methanosarcina sp.]HOW15041.1 hypothetical protein [Methanosarcina sp.]
MSIWVGKKFQLIIQLLQQILENTELAGGYEAQNAYIFMPGRNVCVSE